MGVTIPRIVVARRHPTRTTTRFRTAIVLAVSMVAMMLSAVPAGAATSGTVDASVTVQAAVACITVPAADVDFGTQAFSARGANNTPSAAAFTVENCSGANQTYLGSATNAAGTGSGAWTLTLYDGSTDVCPTTDTFGAGLAPGAFALWLTTLNRPIGGPPTGSFDLTPSMLMPCEGSTGEGETMSFSYNLTASLA